MSNFFFLYLYIHVFSIIFLIFLVSFILSIFFKFRFSYWNYIFLNTINQIFIFFFIFFFYIRQYININFFYHESIFFLINYNIYLLTFLLLALGTANIILLLVNTKMFYHNNNFLLCIFLLMFCFIFFFLEKNLFLVFLYYEFLLIPSYILIYYLSPNKRFLIISLYFLIWTQLGSFLVLLFIVYIYIYYNIIFVNSFLIVSSLESSILLLLLYIGFGIKIPVWPFFFWLTKTHVEAPSFFSIYLSGFLVKTALLGFYKLIKILFITKIVNLLFIFSIYSIIDSSLKMWIQVDLKKLVAFCTVQEMNLIFFLILFNNSNIFVLIILFSLTHAILSSIFFYLIDIIYRLYFTRSVNNLSGLMILSPNLCTSIFIGILLYNGLPFTIKFVVELYSLQVLFNYNLYIYINVIISIGWLGTVGLAKNWFNLMFSSPTLVSFKAFDISKKELLILSYLFFLLIFLINITFYFF